MASAEAVPQLSGRIAVPPAGMLSIAGYVRQFFPDVQFALRDFGAERIPLNEQVRAIRDINPDIVAMAARTFIYPATVTLAKTIKRELPEVRIILGGHHASLMPEDTAFPDCFDTVVRYEGEQAMVDLFRLYEEQKPWPVKYRSPFLTDLSHDYAWDLVNRPEIYARFYSPFHTDPLGSAVWSRGCPFDCFFCSGPALWQGSTPRVRYRSPGSIVNEMKSMYGLGVRRFFIHDDTPNTHVIKFEEILQTVEKENPGMTWGAAGMRANESLTPEAIFPLMYRAGCRYICFGIESGDPEVLHKINRKVSLEEIERALYLTKKYGMRPAGGFSIGHIWLEEDGSLGGEKEENVETTIGYLKKLVRKNLLWSIQFSVIDPVPGSALWRAAEKFNLLSSSNWEDLLLYDRVRLNFRHPFLSRERVDAFYRKAYSIISLDPMHALYLLSTVRTPRDFYGLMRTGLYVLKNRLM